MTSFFHDTAFADLMHLLSRGKFFKSEARIEDPDDPGTYMTRDKDTGEIIVGWDGEDDPANPYNWSFAYKIYVTCLMFFMTMTVYMGSSIVSPGQQDLAEYFGVSETVAALSLTLFILGYGTGPLLLSPITEISWVGRNGPYIFGLGLFSIMQIPNALVNNIAGYMVLRYISGFLGGPVLTTGGASVGDMWSIEDGFMNALAFWDLGSCGSPSFGPLVSGYAADKLGWRWTIWPLFCMNCLTWVILFFTLPETSGETILTRRARQLRKQTGCNLYRSRGELKDRQFTLFGLLLDTFYRPLELTFTEPVLLCSNVYCAYIYGLIYCFFDAFPLTFQGNHGFSQGANGIAYCGGFVGSAVVYLGYCYYNQKYVLPRYIGGNWKPEYRMQPAFVGGIFFPISMFCLLGGLAALLYPITILFYFYGERLREMSKRTGDEPREMKEVIDSRHPESKNELDGHILP
ncbi:hypothetical protein MPSI1_003693 [Malassezia psittaci]|uniref:Major facilitator superfamily (MFS) profile domain-containing protein n=1 Tax=Malassezia psittaci TaxID=1821823 RepID=A0AAF0FCT9_9BASI|nr:hypothetical protein MPSI1_003693 [Malassezia psittaci]